MWVCYNAERLDGVDYMLTLPVTVGNIGMKFAVRDVTMTYIQDETNEGLVLGYTNENGAELYYIDLTGDAPNCVKNRQNPRCFRHLRTVHRCGFESDLLCTGGLRGRWVAGLL